jgi:hypothetical protein
MERHEWPAWWDWVWKWQFIWLSAFLFVFGLILGSRVLNEVRLDALYKENGQVMDAEVVSRRTSELRWLLEDGSGWFRPYKYELGFISAGQECLVETSTWDWIQLSSTHRPYEKGEAVQIALLDDCTMQLIEPGYRGRYLAWQGAHAAMLFLGAGLSIYGHTKWSRHK